MAIEFRGEIGHGRARVWDADRGQAARRAEALLVQDGHRASAHGFFHVLAAVGFGAGQSAEEAAGPDGAGIIGQGGDFGGGGAFQGGVGKNPDQPAEAHGAAVPPLGPGRGFGTARFRFHGTPARTGS